MLIRPMYLGSLLFLIAFGHTVFSAACGDERDQIIQEYQSYSVDLTPGCSDFTQDRHSQYFTFANLNTGDYQWALLRDPFIADQATGYGLDRWKTEYGGSRSVNSAYRNPKHNASVGGASHSRHMHGDAADFNNESQQQKEWDAMRSAATRAQADYVEPQSGPCGLKCTHGDWRSHGGTYQFKPLASLRPASSVIADFRSDMWRTRVSAFYELLTAGYVRLNSDKPETMERIVRSALESSPQNKEQIITELIQLLQREDEIVRQLDKATGVPNSKTSLNARASAQPVSHPQENAANETLPPIGSDDYFTYYGDLISAVSTLQDKRAILGLLGAIGTGQMAVGALARFGPAALDKLVDLAERGSRESKQSAVLAISEFPKLASGLSSTDKQQVKKALLRAIVSDDAFTRMNAVDGLLYFSDADVISALEYAATHDPYEAKEHGGDAGLYPVRTSARNALNKLSQPPKQ